MVLLVKVWIDMGKADEENMHGNMIVGQVDVDGGLALGYDTSLSPKELYQVIKRHFPNIDRDGSGIYGEYRGKKYAIRVKNVTYLGNPHPYYKKRIQIPQDLHTFYEHALKDGQTPILLGIYSHDDAILFCDFHINDFIGKKANNSSAHVYTSDLSAAAEDGFFQKRDYFGNQITVFRPDMVDIFLEDLFEFGDDIVSGDAYGMPERGSGAENQYMIADDSDESRGALAHCGMPEKVFQVFSEYFNNVDKTWKGIECYQKMIADNYRNKYQSEWAGIYFEYDFEKYIRENNLESLVCFAQDKKKGGIDLDLLFPTINAYGDLKAHSSHSRGIQGNDWDTVMKLIESEDSHVYYIVCEHLTKKDSDCGYEVTEYWNRQQNKSNLRSYANHMKNSVQLQKMYILDINKSNAVFLTSFRQGVNSNGKPRKPKIMIEQDQLPHFIVGELQDEKV